MSDPGYVVEYNEDQGSMQFLYDLTNIFLRPIISNDLFPEGFLTTDRYPDLNSLESLPNDVIKDIGEVLDQNKRFIVAVGFGIFFAVLRYLHFRKTKKVMKYDIFKQFSNADWFLLHLLLL